MTNKVLCIYGVTPLTALLPKMYSTQHVILVMAISLQQLTDRSDAVCSQDALILLRSSQQFSNLTDIGIVLYQSSAIEPQ